ncbi:universal stress protein [Cellulomonas sp. McL0617]|uniref:universal stress protein n=1 Tax=Cellulomonas sp. McL0617 TaxID=3415675 RepID=UPI003CF984FB
MTSTVVVGYDGSPQAGAALTWAVREAQRERRPLRIVYVAGSSGRVLFEGLDRVRAEAPDVVVTAALIERDSIADALVAACSDAYMLVLGSRGRGGLQGVAFGSVSASVAARARCPVVIIRADSNERGPARPVVVAVDGSANTAHAIDLAFDQASRLEVPLRAVHAWDLPPMTGTVPAWIPEEIEELDAAEHAVVAESLAGHCERYPDVAVEVVVRRGLPAKVALDAARDAQLLVVGSRGGGGMRGLLLGSVSQAVIRKATCPVMVVHPEHAGAR